MLAAWMMTLLWTAPESDVAGALARLSSQSAQERSGAERWLASHLTARDFAAAAEVAKNGGLEARTRLARAMGADERHFELAVLFYVDPEAELQTIGREALDGLVARWFGEDTLEPWRDKRVASELEGRFRGLYSVQPFGADPDTVVDLLARWAPEVDTDRVRGARLELVVDPVFYVDAISGKGASTTAALDPSTVREGAYEKILARTLSDLRVSFEGFGFEGPHPWIRIGYSADLGRKSGAQLIVDWCRDVLQYPDRPRGEGAARAIAACGWPAPLAWLERRWVERGDRNALAGLLLAAGRGRVVPSLATPASVQSLLDEVADRRALAPRFDLFAQRVRVALQRCPPFGADGSDLAAGVVAAGLWTVKGTSSGVQNFGADGSAYTASILAEIGFPQGEYAIAMRKRLAEPLPAGDVDRARERIALLRMFARHSASNESFGSVELSADMLALVRARRAEGGFVAWFERLKARPADVWATRAGTRALGDDDLALLIDTWIATDARTVAADLIAGWCESTRAEGALADTLARRARIGDGARVADVLELAHERASPVGRTRVERQQLRAGVASAARRRAFVDATLAARVVRPDDWPLVGAVAGEVGGEGLLALLLEHARRVVPVEKNLEAPWSDAFLAALAGLRARQDDVGATKLERELASVLRQTPQHPLRKALAELDPPGQPPVRPLGLEALDGAP